MIETIQESDYLKCWQGIKDPPPFTVFTKFITEQISAYPLETAANVSIALNCKRPGRIDIKGTFNLGDMRWKLSGEIVWLAKSSTFRGHVFLDSHDNLLTGEDLLTQNIAVIKSDEAPDDTEHRPAPSMEKPQGNVDKIKEIYEIIRSVNDEPTDYPGLTKSEIMEKFRSISVIPNDELVQLYSWHNGITYLDAFLGLLPLNDAIEVYKIHQSIKKDNPAFIWKNTWVPILDMNGDIQICLDVATNALWSIDVECDQVKKIADNYSRYVDAILSLLKSGQYSFDSEAGCIAVDSDIWEGLLSDYSLVSAW